MSTLFSESLRIATYNLNNYLVMDRQVGARWRPSYPKPENEKLIIRNLIQEVAPDILILQEMGSVEFLEELRADLAFEGVDYNYALHMRGEDSVRHIAVLATVAPDEVVKHTDLEFKYFNERELVKRGMLEMTFSLGEDSAFKLFAVHLKSRYAVRKDDPESSMRRVKEAEACRNRIIERTVDLEQTQFLVAGDFNDHPASSTMRRFYKRGALETGSRVPSRDRRGELWTYFYRKESRYDTVDGFVASPDMFKYLKSGEGKIVDDPSALNASDHRMVYIDLVKP